MLSRELDPLAEFESIRPNIELRSMDGMISEQVLDQLRIAIMREESCYAGQETS